MSDPVALVVGGAETVWNDVRKAEELCNEVGRPFTYFLINDMIELFPHAGIGITLHPDKLLNWVNARARANLPKHHEYWSHRTHKSITIREAKDWGGSSGLFACKVAHFNLGYMRVILCGVPMSTGGKHFRRGVVWSAAPAFRHGWVKHKHEVAPFVRSLDGWTLQQFGAPDKAWLA